MADATDIADLQKQLLAAAQKIDALAPRLAQARTIKEYDGDRRKALLSRCVAPHLLADDMSATASEHTARASDEYAKGMKELRGERLSAESVIAENDAAHCMFEAVRSILSVQKAAMTL